MQTNPESAAVEAVAYTGQDELDAIAAGITTACTFGTYSERQGRTVPLYPQSALDALRGEVAAERERADKFMWQVRDTCARAEKAERRVEDLTSLLSDTAGNLRRMADDEFADCDQVRLEHVVNRIYQTLAKESP